MSISSVCFVALSDVGGTKRPESDMVLLDAMRLIGLMDAFNNVKIG